MHKHIATIHFSTTDNPKDSQYFERVVADALDGHGLEITDVHVEPVFEDPTWTYEKMVKEIEHLNQPESNSSPQPTANPI